MLKQTVKYMAWRILFRSKHSNKIHHVKIIVWQYFEAFITNDKFYIFEEEKKNWLIKDISHFVFVSAKRLILFDTLSISMTRHYLSPWDV